MISNLRDIWHIVVGYQGTGFMLILYAVSFIYLIITEKEKKIGLLLVYVPLLMWLIIFCPIYYRIYMGKLDDSGTYYRMLWLIPLSVTIAYAGCKAAYKHRIIGGIAVIAAILLCGRFTYTSVENKKAENAYHVPQYVIDLAEHMEEDIKDVNVYACVPLEMVFYLRQYDSRIGLIYGREAVESHWGYYNELYELFEVSESIDWQALLEKTRADEEGVRACTYFVVPEDRQMIGDPREFGLEEIYRTDGKILYRDTVAVEKIREMLKGTPYMS